MHQHLCQDLLNNLYMDLHQNNAKSFSHSSLIPVLHWLPVAMT